MPSGRSRSPVTLSEKTVEGRLARLFARFEVASRTELPTRAVVEGWLDLPGA